MGLLFLFILFWFFMVFAGFGLREAGRPRPTGIHTSCCARCQYTLAGLDSAAPCPECGSADRGSIVHDDPTQQQPAPRWITPLALVCCLLSHVPAAALWFSRDFNRGRIEVALIGGTLLIHAGVCVLTVWLAAGRRERWPAIGSLAVLTGGPFVLGAITYLRAPATAAIKHPGRAEMDAVFALIVPVFNTCLAAVVFIAAAWIATVVMDVAAPRRTASGSCAACGYSLAGIPDSAPCPECGKTKSSPQMNADRRRQDGQGIDA